MARSTDALAAQLKAADNPAALRDAALALLTGSTSRQHVDAAINVLQRDEVRQTLDDDHRTTLRQVIMRYFDGPPERDRAGMIREALVNLLVHIGHPDDADIFRRGVLTYHRIPTTDRAQNLRAASLVGLATVQDELTAVYATRLLGEPDTSELNGEPSITALNVLAELGERLPIYSFLLGRGFDFARSPASEVTTQAMSKLGTDFPLVLLDQLIETYLEADIPAAGVGIVDVIIERREPSLYGHLEYILQRTDNADLHRYAAVMLAASRDTELIEMLYRAAHLSPIEYVSNYIEAVELTQHDEREDTLQMLRRRR